MIHGRISSFVRKIMGRKSKITVGNARIIKPKGKTATSTPSRTSNKKFVPKKPSNGIGVGP